jgi:hypothetical protein
MFSFFKKSYQKEPAKRLLSRMSPTPPIVPKSFRHGLEQGINRPLELMVTLWPSFPHFNDSVYDHRLGGIRLNSAMIESADLDAELALVAKLSPGHVPLYFDIKGRQLRVREAIDCGDHLELVLNHPIEVQTPLVVLLKAGSDRAVLNRIEDGGTRLVFDGGPEWKVKRGESVTIRHPSFKMLGNVFPAYEIEKINKVHKAGFRRYFLSYVESQRDIDQLREMVGDAEIVAKIESLPGLRWVRNGFVKQDNLSLLAARGDLYVEIDKPHQILEATKLIVEKDPDAIVGSRILLSINEGPVPECCDFSDLAWLYDIGYRRMMLCDEICLDGEKLSTAVNVLNAFKSKYAR